MLVEVLLDLAQVFDGVAVGGPAQASFEQWRTGASPFQQGRMHVGGQPEDLGDDRDRQLFGEVADQIGARLRFQAFEQVVGGFGDSILQRGDRLRTECLPDHAPVPRVIRRIGHQHRWRLSDVGKSQIRLGQHPADRLGQGWMERGDHTEAPVSQDESAQFVVCRHVYARHPRNSAAPPDLLDIRR
ncbi:hypothetical protein [Nocardia sp. NPDC004750]